MTLEDFTTYTIVDAESRLTVTANKIEGTNPRCDRDSLVHDDKGAAHFGATFEHDFKMNLRDVGMMSGTSFWAVSNVVEDEKHWEDNNSQAVTAKVWRQYSDPYVVLVDEETADSDSWTNPSVATSYYCTAERTSETAVELRIYSDASRETLVDTLSVTITSGRRYQHVFGWAIRFMGTPSYPRLDLENLDLNEAAIVELSGSAAGQSTAAAVLVVLRKLVGVTAGVSTAAAAMKVVREIIGATAGTSSAAVAMEVLRKIVGTAGGSTAAGPLSLIRFWLPSVSLPEPGGAGRRISWGTEETVLVVVDGDILQEASGGQIDVDRSQVIRQYLEVLDKMPATEKTPLDVVTMTWTGDAPEYYVWRRQDGGDWEKIATTALLEYTDGPLVDADWDYKIEAVDEEGDTATSATAELTVSSAPEPPSALDWSWDDDTLTLTWSASSSADVASYRVRSSAGAQALLLSSASVQDNADLTYEQVFTTETGMWIFSVRAVDSDGNEEANISQVVAIPFEDGAPASRPAEPIVVEAAPSAGGKIKVTWLYDPANEYLGPGAAFEARIYWDNATGTIDWDTPKATVAMGAPTAADWYSWESEALVDEQEYLFAVRIATAAHPNGIETANTDEHAATADTSAPDAPVLAARII